MTNNKDTSNPIEPITDIDLILQKSPWQELAQEKYDEILEDFYQPQVPRKVIVEPKPNNSKLSDKTAYFDFRTNRTHLFSSFIDQLTQEAGLDPETALRGLLKHELGHYVFYPRECSKLMMVHHLAENKSKKHAKTIVAHWMDIMDNLSQIAKVKRGQDILDLYKGMSQLAVTEDLKMSQDPEIRKAFSDIGSDVDEYLRVRRKYSLDRLLTGYYEIQSQQNLDTKLDLTYVKKYSDHLEVNQEQRDPLIVWESDPEKYLEEKVAKLMQIDYLNESNEVINFLWFNAIISDVLKKMEEELPPTPKRSGSGNGEGGLEEGGDYGPRIGDVPNLNDFTDKQLEEGLDKIIREWGKKRYEKIREMVERQTGKTFDGKVNQSKNRGIGLMSSNLKMFDEEISFYVRKARTYGLYIHHKPIVVDINNAHRQGQTIYRVGDSTTKINPYSTGGRILPGVTKRYLESAGKKLDERFKVPNLSIWIDSSGSMVHPSSGSNAILASFILARNYHENDAKVGVVNFSCDTAFLMPTRDLDQVYSILCAYYGGGTCLNVEKIKEYMKNIAKNGKDFMPYYTTEWDYKRLVGHFSPDEQKQFVDKNIHVNLSGDLRDTYNKMDNILITDGGLANIDELVHYMNSTAKITRNTIFLIDNGYFEGGWENLENTQVIIIDRPEDLIGQAIGKSRVLVPEPERPRSLFYK